jgi:hypothetical protein
MNEPAANPAPNHTVRAFETVRPIRLGTFFSPALHVAGVVVVRTTVVLMGMQSPGEEVAVVVCAVTG